MIKYITKDEALAALSELPKGPTKKDMYDAIRAIPNTQVNRSMKIAKMHMERNEEWCPHCKKKLPFYELVNPPPKHCYCMYCGGAIERAKGNRNPYFDKSLLHGKVVENEMIQRPTGKQFKFATTISEKLGIPLPEVRSVQSYDEFIKKNQKAFYDILRGNSDTVQESVEPTKKQVQIAELISKTLNIDMPSEYTKVEYFRYIQHYGPRSRQEARKAKQ